MTYKNRSLVFLLWMGFIFTGCAQSSTSSTPNTYGQVYPLLWENSRVEGSQWSTYILKTIHEEVPSLLNGAEDMDVFCPRYNTLSTNERANFWALLVSAMTKFESNYNPLSRMVETTMGTDPVTGHQVASEGLLQLSYQDVRHYPFCEFDWSKDRLLAPQDPRKTILDPYKNLRCGVKILGYQVENKNRITLGTGAYWAVIKTNNKRNKISQIAALTRQMHGCMKEP